MLHEFSTLNQSKIMRFHNLKFFNTTANKLKILPQQQLKQLSLKNQAIQLSDHVPFLVNLCKKTNVLCWNVMMQCREKNGHFNNGFRKKEEKKEYQTRLIHIIDQVCDWIQQDPSVIAFLGAEGPIEKEDIQIWISHLRSKNIPGWENPHFCTTTFGVTKIFKNGIVAQNTFFEDETVKQALEPALHNRITTYRSSQVYQISNVHIPFQNTKEAYKKILKPVFKDMIKNVGAGYRCHDICGDKNLSYQDELSVIRETWQETISEVEASDKSFSPVTMTIELKLSHDGHMKDIAGKQSYYQVDSALRVIVTKSNKKESEFINLTAEETMKYYVLILCTAVIYNFLNSDTKPSDSTLMKTAMTLMAHHNKMIDREFLLVHEGSHHNHTEQLYTHRLTEKSEKHTHGPRL